VAPHGGGWWEGQVPWQAARLNQPPLAFQAEPHPGALGPSFSFLTVSDRRVAARAVKVAERGDRVVVRLQELSGDGAGVEVTAGTGVAAAWETDGCEARETPCPVAGGAVRLALTAYQPRSLALRLAPPPAVAEATPSRAVELPFDLVAASRDGERAIGGFDDRDKALPAELLPQRLVAGSVTFTLAPGGDGRACALRCRGQEVTLPDGPWDRLSLLAAAAAPRAVGGVFGLGSEQHEVTVHPWDGCFAQWERPARWWRRHRPAFQRDARIAWVGSHRHDRRGRNEPYVFCYLYRYDLAIPRGAVTLTLPEAPAIRLLAVAVSVAGPWALTPGRPLATGLAEPWLDEG